ncbi:hypothetical protein Tco_0097195 [Tanacetum coccineum]
MITGRVIDDLIVFSGETAPQRYMKFFLTQKLAESHHFVNRMHDEADTLRDCVAQMIAVIAEHQAMSDQDEVHDSLLLAKDAKRRFVSIGNDSRADVSKCKRLKLRPLELWIADNVLHNLIYIYTLSLKVLNMAALYILDKLIEVADSSHLVNITKNMRLIAELEALGQRVEALKPLDYMKEMVGRDFAILGVLEQLLAGTHVGMRLKASYVAEMKETE